MQANYFDRMITAANFNGQGIANAVEGTHRTTLRSFVSKSTRHLSLRLASWRAHLLKRMPVAMTPALAACPIQSASRCQRDQRWMSGVVVDPGTVGVC